MEGLIDPLRSEFIVKSGGDIAHGHNLSRDRRAAAREQDAGQEASHRHADPLCDQAVVKLLRHIGCDRVLQQRHTSHIGLQSRDPARGVIANGADGVIGDPLLGQHIVHHIADLPGDLV